ncbi:WW domain-containing oxidoreductase-like [Anneissia japonica]|uniref:WW domain-containing oxidoreductase-like n=1 Tax=Anneissia japonica TaxID=1529436 RepID=UPI0014254CDE|nr:WW domain-containing oxidoreductase-like [Anneissia japonica]
MATGGSYIDSDSDDDLPAGWEERTDKDGFVFYANHTKQTTQWTHPRTGKTKQVTGELPYGWAKKTDEKGRLMYVDHVSKRTTYTDPRLAFATEHNPNKKAFNQRFDAYSTAMKVLEARDLTGKYIIITGANSGIGYETAKSLAFHGAHVTMACRNMVSARACIQKIKQERSEAKVEVMNCDLASLCSVKEFAESYKLKEWPLHVVICNAGVFGMPWSATEDGYETTFQVCHLGHFYLVNLLTDLLITSAPSRVVMVSSESHRFIELRSKEFNVKTASMAQEDYWPILAYGRAKLCNILFANEYNRRYRDQGVTSNSLHPGNMIHTGIQKNWWLYRILFALVRPFTKSLQQGSATSVFCAVSNDLEGTGGLYLNHCCICEASDEAKNEDKAKELWELSECMINKCIY